MRIAGDTIGPRGIAVLAVSAVVGVLLGLHGWSGSGTRLAARP